MLLLFFLLALHCFRLQLSHESIERKAKQWQTGALVEGSVNVAPGSTEELNADWFNESEFEQERQLELLAPPSQQQQ